MTPPTSLVYEGWRAAWKRAAQRGGKRSLPKAGCARCIDKLRILQVIERLKATVRTSRGKNDGNCFKHARAMRVHLTSRLHINPRLPPPVPPPTRSRDPPTPRAATLFYSTKASEIVGAHPIGERLREPPGPSAPRAASRQSSPSRRAPRRGRRARRAARREERGEWREEKGERREERGER